MKRRMNRRVLGGLIAAVLVTSAVSAWACSVPVFRYALERWTSDTYHVIVFYRGELTEEQQRAVDALRPEGLAGEKFANVQVHAFDIDALDPANDEDAQLLALWEEEQKDTLPLMVAYYPFQSLARGSIWSGPPTMDAVERLLDSPVRRETARRILKGDTAVWVFLEGGDKQRDDEKFRVLEENLRRAEKTLKLPEIDEQDVADGLVTIDPAKLKVRFSAIRLSRDDPREEMFVNMLLLSEEGLTDAEFDGQPMAFPIFGRGRALYALVGDGIAEGTIFDGCAFLIGPCTCQVKAQNEHGVDMLTAVDWDGLIQPAVQIDQELPPLSGLGAFAMTKTTANGGGNVDGNGHVSGNGNGGDAAGPVKSSGDDDEQAATSPNRPETRADTPSTGSGSSSMMTTTLIVLALAVIGVVLGSIYLTRQPTA